MLSEQQKESKYEVKKAFMEKFNRESRIKTLEHFLDLPANVTRSFYMPL